MSKKANNLLIGSFVLGAIAIAVAGVIVLTAGEFMKDSKQFIMYFDGDLSGLDVGAPLDYKGVKIGKVVDISIVYDYDNDSVAVPVVVEINRNSFTAVHGDKENLINHDMARHIKRGLRAQLKTQSLVTGKLKITLAYDANAKKPPVFRAKNTDIPEIPTIPGSLDSLAKQISELPLEEIVVDVRKVTQAMSKIADSGNVEKLTQSLVKLAHRLDNLPLEAIATDVQDTTKSLAAIIDSGEVRDVLKSLNMTLRESQQLMLRVNKESEPFKDEMLMLMEQFSSAAESIKYLAEYLERHPEAMLHGKGKE